MHAVIFAGGTLRPGSAVNRALAGAELIIAADKGAEIALQYGYMPAFVVGDLDSLTLSVQELEARGCIVVHAPEEKDETDTELAIQTALQQGARSITLLGGLGGARFDHAMANILMLAAFDKVSIRIVDGPTICWLLRGPGSARIDGQPGDLLSLFPLAGDATGISTSHLYYPLYNATLQFGKPRGVSNRLISEQAEVQLLGGMLLITHINIQELQE